MYGDTGSVLREYFASMAGTTVADLEYSPNDPHEHPRGKASLMVAAQSLNRMPACTVRGSPGRAPAGTKETMYTSSARFCTVPNTSICLESR